MLTLDRALVFRQVIRFLEGLAVMTRDDLPERVAGIAALADHFAGPYERSGELVPVLADWSLPTASAWAVFPGRRLMPARTRVFLDALQAEFSGPKCQQVEAQVQQTKRERLTKHRLDQNG